MDKLIETLEKEITWTLRERQYDRAVGVRDRERSDYKVVLNLDFAEGLLEELYRLKQLEK